MKIVSVVGARPQFVKLAPVAEAVQDAGHQHVIVHTGQHYDVKMSQVFFADLKIPAPDIQLGVGSGSHGVQTGRMLAQLDPVLAGQAPDWVLVYGDTNSTLAGALSAVKQHLPLAHLEAGLRSGNRRMPEEHNRVLTDHAADLLLAPTGQAMANLAAEGLGTRSRLVGDVMTDICLRMSRASGGRRPAVVDREIEPGEEYVLATVHRAENTDDPDRLRAIMSALQGFSMPVLLAAHPRLVDRAANSEIDLAAGAVRLLEPLGYAEMVAATASARAVVTDSGGLQKEAFLLGTDCTTLRGETEWPETLEGGHNVLALDHLADLNAVALRGPFGPADGQPYGSGDAAARVVEELSRKSNR